jgi:hypothetical protein
MKSEGSQELSTGSFQSQMNPAHIFSPIHFNMFLLICTYVYQMVSSFQVFR